MSSLIMAVALIKNYERDRIFSMCNWFLKQDVSDNFPLEPKPWYDYTAIYLAQFIISTSGGRGEVCRGGRQSEGPQLRVEKKNRGRAKGISDYVELKWN